MPWVERWCQRQIAHLRCEWNAPWHHLVLFNQRKLFTRSPARLKCNFFPFFSFKSRVSYTSYLHFTLFHLSRSPLSLGRVPGWTRNDNPSAHVDDILCSGRPHWTAPSLRLFYCPTSGIQGGVGCLSRAQGSIQVSWSPSIFNQVLEEYPNSMLQPKMKQK